MKGLSMPAPSATSGRSLPSRSREGIEGWA
jgi:hypothetical protein